MNSEKLQTAKAAISYLVFNLLEKDDELFFIEFGFNARLTQGWTTDRRLIRYALDDVSHPAGDTGCMTPSPSRCQPRRRVVTATRRCS